MPINPKTLENAAEHPAIHTMCAKHPQQMCDTCEFAVAVTAQAETIRRLREALLRNRQGYLNILEMRKLDSEKWGQRDGYGGRYGALTRDEIDGVIAEIDAALADPSAPKETCGTCGGREWNPAVSNCCPECTMEKHDDR